MRKFLSARRRYALLPLVGGAATLVIMGASCQPTKPPAPTGLSISPTTQDFGAVPTGDSSPSQTFTVTNNGPNNSGTLTVDFETGNTNQFAISNDNCSGKQIDASATCTVDAALQPTTADSLTTNLVVKSDVAADGTATATLSGIGFNAP
jgi:hypothetical protein